MLTAAKTTMTMMFPDSEHHALHSDEALVHLQAPYQDVLAEELLGLILPEIPCQQERDQPHMGLIQQSVLEPYRLPWLMRCKCTRNNMRTKTAVTTCGGRPRGSCGSDVGRECGSEHLNYPCIFSPPSYTSAVLYMHPIVLCPYVWPPVRLCCVLCS